MKIYTRMGDKGKTQIAGGQLVSKDDIRIESNGILDEANCYIGLLRAHLPLEHQWQNPLHRIQTDMMNMMSHIATPSSLRELNGIEKPEDGAQFCEQWIDDMLAAIPEPHDYFLLPGGTTPAALCHVIRTVMRTAERRLISLHKEDPLEDYILRYVNRLSDLFFIMARYQLFEAGYEEEKLRPFRQKPNTGNNG